MTTIEKLEKELAAFTGREVGTKAYYKAYNALLRAKRRATAPTFAVGDGATYGYGSDSYPATVIAISKSGHKLTTRDDKATPAPGHEGPYGAQVYTYEPNPNGAEREWSRRADGHYRRIGEDMRSRSLGKGRRFYRDPHF